MPKIPHTNPEKKTNNSHPNPPPWHTPFMSKQQQQTGKEKSETSSHLIVMRQSGKCEKGEGDGGKRMPLKPHQM
jgi:hypothetical protein